MGQQLEFQLNLTGTFAAALGPVNSQLADTEKLMSKAAHSTRSFMSLGDHMKVGQAFQGLFQNVQQSSLSLQEHSQIAQALGGFFGDLGKMADRSSPKVRKFGLEWGNMFHSFGGFRIESGKLIFNVSQGLETIIGLASRAASAFASLATSVIRTAGESQDLNLAVKLTAGAGAGGVNDLASSFGNTRFDDDEIKRALLPLLDVGITDKGMLDNLATAAADIFARTGGRTGIDQALDTFQKIALKGEVDARSLRTLGISESSFFDNLGDLLGRSAKSAEEMTKSGKVKPATLLSVALDEIAKREGGALGGGALAGGKTLGGVLARLGNLGGNVFKKIAAGPGMAAIQASIEKFIDLLNGPAGTKFMSTIDAALVKLAGLISPERIEGWIGALSNAGTWFESIRGTVDTIITASEVLGVIWAGGKIVGAFSSLAAILPGVATTAGLAAAPILAMAAPLIAAGAAAAALAFAFVRIRDTVKELGGLGRVFDDLKFWAGGKSAAATDAVNDNSPAWKRRGVNVVAAYSSGMESGLSSVQNASSSLANASILPMESGLQIQSPSRVMAGIGRHVTEGFALGIEDGVGRVESAARRSLVDTVLGGARGSGSARSSAAGGPVSVQFGDVYVSGAGEQGAKEFVQLIRVELAKVFDEVAA